MLTPWLCFEKMDEEETRAVDHLMIQMNRIHEKEETEGIYEIACGGPTLKRTFASTFAFWSRFNGGVPNTFSTISNLTTNLDSSLLTSSLSCTRMRYWIFFFWLRAWKDQIPLFLSMTLSRSCHRQQGQVAPLNLFTRSPVLPLLVTHILGESPGCGMPYLSLTWTVLCQPSSSVWRSICGIDLLRILILTHHAHSFPMPLLQMHPDSSHS